MMDIFDVLDDDTKELLRKLTPLQQAVLLEPLPGEADYDRRMRLYDKWKNKQKDKEEVIEQVSERFEPWPPEESEGCDADRAEWIDG
jgi:hypothetical protein